jgi:hypothetical protein
MERGDSYSARSCSRSSLGSRPDDGDDYMTHRQCHPPQMAAFLWPVERAEERRARVEQF